MSNVPARRQPRSWPPDWSEFWSDLWTGFPPLAALRPGHLIRLEDEMADGHYVLRAELPGIDPAKDIDITVHRGQLTIKAERSEKKETKGRSEFSYGSFTRTVTLPAGANEDDIKASYDKGILTVDWPCPNKPRRPPRSTSRCKPPAKTTYPVVRELSRARGRRGPKSKISSAPFYSSCRTESWAAASTIAWRAGQKSRPALKLPAGSKGSPIRTR